MEKYVMVAWPESQEWVDNDVCWVCWGGTPTVFVPEELYNKVNGEV